MDEGQEIRADGNIPSECMREWQKPLTPEKIALLVEQFAEAKARVDYLWGQRIRPWTQARLRHTETQGW